MSPHHAVATEPVTEENSMPEAPAVGDAFDRAERIVAPPYRPTIVVLGLVAVIGCMGVAGAVWVWRASANLHSEIIENADAAEKPHFDAVRATTDAIQKECDDHEARVRALEKGLEHVTTVSDETHDDVKELLRRSGRGR